MKEKKKYWWRFIVVIISFLGLIYAYIMIYSEELHIYEIRNDVVIFLFGYQRYTDPLYFIFLSIFLTSIFTFFISDKIFKKWLKFTFWWFLVAIIWIAILPDSVNFLAIPATKENVSIWMSVGFVIISLIMFIWMSMKGKKN